MRSPFLLIPLAVALASGCSKEPAAPTVDPTANAPASTAMKADSRSHDESSYAEPDKVVVKDIALDLKLDFDSKQIGGTATYTLEWKDKAAKQLVLDTRELSVEKVEAIAADGKAAPLPFVLAPADKVFGSKLSIETPDQPAKVVITYHTAPTASGLQWLEPSMTEGKKLPFMFSQSQAIHARSWVPLQDPERALHLQRARGLAPGRDGADERRQRSQGRA